MENYNSVLIEKAVSEFTKLPGIGKKSALRFCLHLLKQNELNAEQLGQAIIQLRKDISYCSICHNISDEDICNICKNPKRNDKCICIVQDIRDVMAIENTAQYNGLYHILNGIISPMNGIGPQDLTIDSLLTRLKKQQIEEMIFALPSTIEGDTTAFYLFKRTQEFNINISTIAKGIAIGDELEYADEITLGRSIINRMPYNK